MPVLVESLITGTVGLDGLAGVLTELGSGSTTHARVFVDRARWRTIVSLDGEILRRPCSADFATAPMFFRTNGKKRGVFTRDRRPKASAACGGGAGLPRHDT